MLQSYLPVTKDILQSYLPVTQDILQSDLPAPHLLMLTFLCMLKNVYSVNIQCIIL